MPKYKLYYFDCRARGEFLRLMLAQARAEYEDIRISFDQWPKYKPKMQYGGLPTLEVDGKQLGQSLAIGRYLAKQLGLAGQSAWETAQADAAVDALMEIVSKVFPLYFTKEDKERNEKLEDLKKNQLQQQFDNINREIGSCDSPWIVGNSITWADIFLYETVTKLISFLGPDFYQKWPRIAGCYKAVSEQRNIEDWVAKRPKSKLEAEDKIYHSCVTGVF